MTPDRFQALTEAYGADRRRWPAAERAQAEAFASTRPDLAAPALARADAIDSLLHASALPRVSVELRDRVIAAAATGRRAGKLWIDRLLLVFGAGWAAAACAGVAAGVMLTAHVTADAQADAVLYQASLSGVDDVEVLG